MKRGIFTKISCVFIFALFMMLSLSFRVQAYDEEIASKLVSMTQTEDAEIVNEDSPFKTKRLIVETYENIDLMGAVDYVKDDGYYILQYKNEEDTQKAYEYYSLLESVEYVEADAVIKSEAVSDYSYVSWGGETMDVGSYSNYLNESIGKNNLKEIIIAVLDSGIDTDHSWFVNRIVSGGKNFSSSTNSGAYQYEDKKGHGTHVSGIIVDLTFSNVKILPIKVLNDNGDGYVSTAIEAIEYVMSLKQQGKNIVAMNLSFGGDLTVGGTLHKKYAKTIENAYNLGILAIASAGNEGDNVSKYAPANIEQAITVSAVAQEETLVFPNWSNYGSYVDVSAPGQYIYSAGVGGGVISKSGTSMAAPHVSAAVALLYSDSNNNYTIQDIEQILDDTAIDLGTAGWDKYYGEGCINLEKAHIKIIDDVNFSNKQSNHNEPFSLALTSNESNVTIRYTTDGTEPSLTNGIIYSSPITVSKTTKVKAIAYGYHNGRLIKQSKVSGYTYYFNGYDLEEAYVVDSNGQILEYNGPLTELVVPSYIKGVKIVKIGNYAFNNSKVTKITLAESITQIGDYSFANSKIKEIYAPSVTSIGKSAFISCSNLTIVNETFFPNVVEVGNSAFSNCVNLTKINLPQVVTIGEFAFYDCTSLEEVISPLLENIYQQAFVNNYRLSKIDTTDIKTLGTVTSSIYVGHVFDNCINLKQIYLPNIQVMANSIFTNSGITKIVISDTLVKYHGDPISSSSNLTVYGYKGSLIEQYCEEKGINFIVMDSLKIIDNLLSEKPINNTSINQTLYVEAAGFELTYEWFEVMGQEHVEMGIVAKKLNINQSNHNKLYFVRVYNWDGTYVDSNICRVIYTELDIYNIVTTIEGKGSVLPSNNISVIKNNSVKITFSPSKGYEVSSIIIDGVEVDSSNLNTIMMSGYTFSNVEGNHEISVLYIKKTYTVEYIREIDGDTTTKTFSVQYGDNLKITIDSVDHYHIDRILLNNRYFTYAEILDAGENGYTLRNIEDNQKLQVVFKIDTFKITVEKNDKVDTYIANYGTSYKIKCEEPVGYYISSITIDGTALSEEEMNTFISEGYEFENITSNHVVRIVIEKVKFTLISISDEFGKISPSGEIVVEYGDSQLFTFSANEGYEISQILLDDKALSGSTFIDAINNGFILSNIQKNYKIELRCEKLKLIIDATVIGEGSITPGGEVIVEYGDNKTFIIDVEDNHHVHSIRVGSRSLSNQEIQSALKDGYTFENVTNNTSITVIIKIDTHSITSTSDQNGKIIPSGEIQVDHGGFKKYEFVANVGYEIDKIIINGEELSQEILVTVINNGYVFKDVITDNTIEVTYKLKTYTLEITVKGNGSVTPEGKTTLKHGESQLIVFESIVNHKLFELTINSVVLSGEELSSIEKDGYLVSNIDKDYKIEVVFDKVTYIIHSSIEGDGTISPSGDVSVKYGESQKFTIDIEDHKYVSHLYINSVALTQEQIQNVLEEGYLFTNVKSSKSIRVVVKDKTFNISASNGDNGLISPKGTMIVKYGESQMFRFVPYSGYEVDKILIDNVELEQEELLTAINEGYMFENVKANHSIRVEFKKVTYTINASSSEGGTIDKNGIIVVDSGDNEKFTFTPNEGYFIKDVIVNNHSLGTLDSYEFINIAMNHNIKVEFAIKTYDVSVEIEGKGNVECEQELENINYGSSRTIKFVAEEGYELYKVLVDDNEVEIKDLELKFESIISNKEIKVMFVRVQSESPQEIQVNISCDKNGSGNIMDFLFMVFVFAIFAFPKKRLIKF